MQGQPRTRSSTVARRGSCVPSGVAFKQRIEAILEPLPFVLEQQERERRALEAGWAKNEKAVKQAITSVAVL